MSEQTPKPAESGAVHRARTDLAAGREWKARDRLVGHLAGEYDAEALELLGEVLYAMRDLPSAGGAWFGTGRRGHDVDESIEAWRERHHDHFPEMWRSLPRSVRDHDGNKRVDALRRKVVQQRAEDQGASGAPSSSAPGGGGIDTAVVIAVALAVVFVVCAIIGFVTAVGWMVH
ncbi:MAG TPA: DUF6584 family protein [Pedococcus sp.]|nr:DUF6584 family protein [Pedococcus sp.]